MKKSLPIAKRAVFPETIRSRGCHIVKEDLFMNGLICSLLTCYRFTVYVTFFGSFSLKERMNPIVAATPATMKDTFTP